MHPNQILVAGLLFLGVSCEDMEDGTKKPAVVDWEAAHFGTRTSHPGSQEDLLNTVNIDTDAPKIPKRKTNVRQNQRKKFNGPNITRNNLIIRSRNQNNENSEVDEGRKKLRTTSKIERMKPRKTRLRNHDKHRESSTDHLKYTFKSQKTYVNKSEDLRPLGKPRSASERRTSSRAGRFRTRISHRRATTESAIKFDNIEENISSSLELKTNFADFKESFLEKTENISKNSMQSNTEEYVKLSEASTLEAATTTSASTTTSTSTTTSASTTSTSTTTETGTTTLLSTNIKTSTAGNSQHENTQSLDAKDASLDKITTDNVVKDTDEYVTQTSSIGDRSIPKIGDPAVAEKLNRLSVGRRSEIKRKRKPENVSAKISSISRSRGTIRFSSTNQDKNKLIESAKVDKLNVPLASRPRLRRPSIVRHRATSTGQSYEESPIIKSIKRMKIKSNDRRVVKDKSAGDISATIKQKPVKAFKVRAPPGKRNGTIRTEPLHTKKITAIKMFQNTVRSKDQPEAPTPTTTSTTTEKITISPNAHKISYTLDDQEYTELVPARPKLPQHTATPEPNINKDDLQPLTAQLMAALPIPDNMFSQATHQLMKAKKDRLETILPTLVPPIHVSASTESTAVTVGTRQLDEKERQTNWPVKRARFIRPTHKTRL